MIIDTILIFSLAICAFAHAQRQMRFFVDNSSGCWRDAYARHSGVVASKCPARYDLIGSLCFVACKAGYEALGPLCLKATPNKDGEPPQADKYYRGPGELAKCDPNSEYTDQNGPFCFRRCEGEYQGIGRACVAVNCPAKLPFPCGPVCTPSFNECTKDVLKLTAKGYQALFKFALGHPGDGLKTVRELVKQLLAWPTCHRLQGALEEDELSLE